jgi:hypothetical protein
VRRSSYEEEVVEEDDDDFEEGLVRSVEVQCIARPPTVIATAITHTPTQRHPIVVPAA